mgnify:CR=1 FL=1
MSASVPTMVSRSGVTASAARGPDGTQPEPDEQKDKRRRHGDPLVIPLGRERRAEYNAAANTILAMTRKSKRHRYLSMTSA